MVEPGLETIFPHSQSSLLSYPFLSPLLLEATRNVFLLIIFVVVITNINNNYHSLKIYPGHSSYINLLNPHNNLMRVPCLWFSLQLRKLVERLSNLPQVTQLANDGARPHSCRVYDAGFPFGAASCRPGQDHYCRYWFSSTGASVSHPVHIGRDTGHIMMQTAGSAPQGHGTSSDSGICPFGEQLGSEHDLFVFWKLQEIEVSFWWILEVRPCWERRGRSWCACCVFTAKLGTSSES